MRKPRLFQLATFIALAIAATRAGAQASAITSVAHAPWTRRATMYEVNVRQYTPEGTFNAFARHLPQLASMHVDILWFMPIHPIGVVKRKEGLGSPYSVKDYKAVNPEFGTLADFKRVVNEAHRLGMRVILDWVPNHSSFDNAWVTQHPDWYVHKADGTIMNARDGEDHETDWTDVAELNYDSPGLRAAMLSAMRYWIDEAKVDGFRCDVAGGVPMDFWMTARRELQKAKPGLFMLAEAEGPQFSPAFDMTYGWEFHHLLNEIAQGKQGVNVIDDYLAREATKYPADAYHMYFTSNHDENSWNGTEFERMGANHQAAFVLAATIFGGMPEVYSGQEVSLNKRLRFFEKDTVDWKGASLAKFYGTMFDLKHRNRALANGAEGGPQARIASDNASRTYVFSRTRGGNTVLVGVNFGDKPASVALAALDAPGNYRDWFTKARQKLTTSSQLEIPAHGYRVLVR